MRRVHPARRAFSSSFSSFTPAPDHGEAGLPGAGTAGRAVVVVQLDETRAGGNGAPGFEITETAVAAADPNYFDAAPRIVSTVICKRGILVIRRASDWKWWSFGMTN